MSDPVVEPIEFTLNGRLYVLARAVVEGRLEGVEPRAIREHAVLVNGEWFPARQALAVALGIPDHLVKSRTARAKLAALGFESRRPPVASGAGAGSDQVSDSGSESASDQVLGSDSASEPGAASESPHRNGTRGPKPQGSEGGRPPASGRPARQARRTPDPGRPEADVQASVVAALTAAGWAIRSVANTATKEHGIDVIAEREGQTIGVEVKGFPGLGYADPARSDQRKRTRPSSQAVHWYSQAILAAMRLRTKHPEWRSVIALPDHPRYRTLHTETAGSLAAAAIDVWWVDTAGDVSGL
jgi:Holliday junction resolvase-like predicted endonuclease